MVSFAWNWDRNWDWEIYGGRRYEVVSSVISFVGFVSGEVGGVRTTSFLFVSPGLSFPELGESTLS